MLMGLVTACGSAGGPADEGSLDADGVQEDLGAVDDALPDGLPDADPGVVDVQDLAVAPEDVGDLPLPDTTAELPPVADGPPYTRHVNPFMGTGGAMFNLGSALPGATRPFGMVKVSPDTVKGASGMPVDFQHCAGYRYEDDHIEGFSHNHLHGTGIGDYGNVLIMPTIEMTDATTVRKGHRAPFAHEDEEAAPGRYAVTLTDPLVRVELTATPRCAHHRYTWLDATDEAVILIDAAAALSGGRSKGGAITVDAVGHTVEGWTHNHGAFSGRYGGFKVYFAVRFRDLPSGMGTWLDGRIQEGRSAVETTADPASFGAYLRFSTVSVPTIEAQVCLSYVSVAGARAALTAEMPSWAFEATRDAAEAAWEAELSKIEVSGGTADHRAVFYTSLYHALQMPTLWSDVDGRYTGFDGQVHVADGWDYVTDISLWDTYRTQNPLLTLAWPQWQASTLQSLAMMVAQGDYVPKWPMGAGDTNSMIGQHAASTAADTWLKGVTEFDIDTLWAGLQQTADGPLPAGAYGERSGIEPYLERGYVPSDVTGGSVSKTLEYAFNDFCLSRLAAARGQQEDAARYLARSDSWRNLWDESTFFMPRQSDGTFESVGVLDWPLPAYVEGSAWQWNWSVPHDEAGLAGMFSSTQAFVDKLNEFFVRAQESFTFEVPGPWYYHGNEPDFHAPFLFIRAGRPDLTQRWVRWILEDHYRNAPDGLIGNDDAGTLGAWYVFASSGLFPWPCLPGYYVTTPLFDEVLLHLPGGNVTIRAPGATTGKVYIQDAKWNGNPLDPLWIDHEALASGGILELTLAETPGR